MNKYHLPVTFLCDQANDGTGGNASGSSEANSNNTGGTGESQSRPEAVKDVWGGREAPGWTKQIGLEEKHTQTEQAAGVVAPVAPTQTQNQPASSAPTPALAPTPAPQPQTQQPFDVDKLASAIGKAMRPPEPGAQPLTPEQIRQQLGIYDMSADDYEAILGVKPDSPARLAAFNKVLQAVAKQATTVASVLNQNALGDMQRKMDPYMASAKTQEAERQKNLFFTEHKDLTGYDALIEREFNALIATGYRVTNVAEARKAVADRTRETLKSLGVTPNPTGRQVQATTQPTDGQAPRQTRQMAPTSGGGRGAGSAQSKSQSTNKIEAVWGKP